MTNNKDAIPGPSRWSGCTVEVEVLQGQCRPPSLLSWPFWGLSLVVSLSFFFFIFSIFFIFFISFFIFSFIYILPFPCIFGTLFLFFLFIACSFSDANFFLKKKNFDYYKLWFVEQDQQKFRLCDPRVGRWITWCGMFLLSLFYYYYNLSLLMIDNTIHYY